MSSVLCRRAAAPLGPLFWGLLLGCAIVAPGCGPEPTGSRVSGTISFNGKPLQRGSVLFNPIDDALPAVRAEIQKDGLYELIAEPGEYKIIVTSLADDPPTLAPDHPDYVRPTSTIPKRYGGLQTTPLQQVVPPSDAVIDFTL